MTEIAPIVLDIIKTYRRVTSQKIFIISGITKRRIYDVTVILEALKMIRIELPKKGKGKIYVWCGTSIKKEGKKINSNKIKVSCENGSITRVQNNPVNILIEASHNITVENYNDFLNE